jgi:hypothetical protein
VGPTCQPAGERRGREWASGIRRADLRELGRCGEKEKGWGGLFGLDGEMVRVWFCFFSFSFQPLVKNLFKFFLKNF